jgi:ferredoxin
VQVDALALGAAIPKERLHMNKNVKKKLVIRAETLQTLSDDSLRAVAGGIKPETTDVSFAHCTGGGSCGTCHTPICNGTIIKIP